VDDRIRPALETGQGIRSKRPVLVVIDEVDGATGENVSFVPFLLLLKSEITWLKTGSFVQKLIQLTMEKPRKKCK